MGSDNGTLTQLSTSAGDIGTRGAARSGRADDQQQQGGEMTILGGMKCLLLIPALVSVALADCPLGTHVCTGIFSADLYGPFASRPGTGGHADYVVKTLTFKNVPAGCRVQIVRIVGDFVAWPAGPVPDGTQAGVLVGAYRTSGSAS